MASNPSRAKRRISSKASHGFFSRFRRSTRCALVSVLVSAIKEKPTASFLLAMGSISADTKKSLGQQPPCARRHECTTTSTTTHAVVILLVKEQHNVIRF